MIFKFHFILLLFIATTDPCKDYDGIAIKQTGETICCAKSCGSCGGIGYILGVIGAAVYYISSATGFWNGVLGLLKSLVWPPQSCVFDWKYTRIN